MQQHPGEFTLKTCASCSVAKYPFSLPAFTYGQHHPGRSAASGSIPAGRCPVRHGSTGGHDGRCVQRPERRELDAALFEHHLVGLPVRLQDVPTFPFDLVVRVNSGVVYSGSMVKPVVFRSPLPLSRLRCAPWGMDCSVICPPLDNSCEGPFVPFGDIDGYFVGAAPTADDWL